MHVSGTSDVTYEVTVTDPCGNQVSGTLFTTQNTFNYTDPSLIIEPPTSFNPLSGPLFLPERGLSWAEVPAYSSYNANLSIYDRWGQNFYNKFISPASQTGFYNGELKWNGTDNSGNPVSESTYLIYLYLYDCKNDRWNAIFHYDHWVGFLWWGHTEHYSAWTYVTLL